MDLAELLLGMQNTTGNNRTEQFAKPGYPARDALRRGAADEYVDHVQGDRPIEAWRKTANYPQGAARYLDLSGLLMSAMKPGWRADYERKSPHQIQALPGAPY